MNRNELASRLARQTRSTRAAAADRLDQLVHDILVRLRRGEKVTLPGLGTFVPGPQTAFEPEPRRGRGK
jgi:nucleoid DNA-binding protein